MIHSGEVYDLSSVLGLKIDKHSTGGVGDKVSIALAPLVAAAGGIVPMVSGRGLGHTGGTLDKLESIPGFRTQLSPRQFKRQLEKIGVAMAGQSRKLAPADGKLYALRDVTGTVESIPLIAASILSKKAASGNDGVVMDVKVGSGAFMPTARKSRELAESLVSLGARLDMKVVAYLTDMSQPLGAAIGNALEVRECLELLRGAGPADLLELTLELGARMLVLGRREKSHSKARATLRNKLASGEAYEKFILLVEAQKGDPRALERKNGLKAAPLKMEVRAPANGWLARVDTRAVGMACVVLGGGRMKKEDAIDPSVGFVMRRKIGDAVEKGEPIFEIYSPRQSDAAHAARRLASAIRIDETPTRPPKLIKGYVGNDK
jgi:pyrimidine-nucleoside phosphorylase